MPSTMMKGVMMAICLSCAVGRSSVTVEAFAGGSVLRNTPPTNSKHWNQSQSVSHSHNNGQSSNGADSSSSTALHNAAVTGLWGFERKGSSSSRNGNSGGSSSRSLSVRGGAAGGVAQFEQEPPNFAMRWISKYSRQLEVRPLPTKIITSAIISSIGDVLAQSISTPGHFDLTRMVSYGLVGGFWLAPIVHYWYQTLQSTFGSNNDVGSAPKTVTKKIKTALPMVAIDQALGAFVSNGGYILFFTALTALMSGAADPVGALNLGSRKLSTTLMPTMYAAWRLWPVVSLINFSFVPPKLQVLFVNCVNLFWGVIMSMAIN